MEIEVIEPDYYYHIFNRGINRQPIYANDNHYYKFLELCRKYLPQNSDLLAYCLIPNHFHFLIYIRPDWMSKPFWGCNNSLGNVCNSYAQWFNKQTGRTGGLFQSPFKRKKVMDQEYLKQLIYYIHRNPMHHKLTEDPTKYTFSSYQTILNDQPTILNREQVLDWFDGPANFIDYHNMRFEIDSDEFFDEF